MSVCLSIYLSIYVCMYVCMYGCMDVWMYGCMYVRFSENGGSPKPSILLLKCCTLDFGETPHFRKAPNFSNLPRNQGPPGFLNSAKQRTPPTSCSHSRHWMAMLSRPLLPSVSSSRSSASTPRVKPTTTPEAYLVTVFFFATLKNMTTRHLGWTTKTQWSYRKTKQNGNTKPPSSQKTLQQPAPWLGGFIQASPEGASATCNLWHFRTRRNWTSHTIFLARGNLFGTRYPTSIYPQKPPKQHLRIS